MKNYYTFLNMAESIKSNIIEIKKDFTEELTHYIQVGVQTDKVIIIKFSVEWCSPCKVLKNKLMKADQEGKLKNIIVLAVDAEKSGREVIVRDWKNDDLKLEFSSVPTLFIFQDGKLIEQGNDISEEKLNNPKLWITN